MANEWNRPDAPPPPLFTGKKEKDFVKQINDEVIERIIGQGIFYYPISVEHTEFHEIYGEAITKTFLPPIRVHALVEWTEYITEVRRRSPQSNKYSFSQEKIDRRSKLIC